MHVDTGHNFAEVIDYRDRRVAELGIELIVGSVQDDIDAGRVVEETGPRASRNRLQTTTLLRSITEYRADAVFGGARRDEEKARAKERIFSFRDEFGQWDPKNQRPELWSLYNTRHRKGEHMRVFPLSNWTELDIWQYIAADGIEIPSIYFAHQRQVVQRDGMFVGVLPEVTLLPDEVPFEATVRYRTVGDTTCTGAVESDADTVEKIIEEVAATRITERGATRADDRISEAGMEDRKKEGLLLMSELLRFATAGSVDDGKSTLIGRLLYDSKSIFEDQLDAVERVSRERGEDYTNLALLTDGLRAEREQGITIDVAYRYFATPKRKFIIADTPGHTQYTRNMVTGASTADVALILIDARQGVLEQSRRHAFLSSLLGIPHLVVCINKMDLVDWSQDRFEEIKNDFRDFATKLEIHDLTFIPMSALQRRQRGQPLGAHAVVRGPAAAQLPRRSAHRLRPQSDRRSLPGAVRRAADAARVPRLPRLRRHGRGWRVPPRRRGHGAAEWDDVADQADRHLRWPRRRGLPADGRDDSSRRPGRHLPR